MSPQFKGETTLFNINQHQSIPYFQNTTLDSNHSTQLPHRLGSIAPEAHINAQAVMIAITKEAMI